MWFSSWALSFGSENKDREGKKINTLCMWDYFKFIGATKNKLYSEHVSSPSTATIAE